MGWNQSKPVFWTVAKPIRTGPIGSVMVYITWACGLDQLQSQLTHFGVEKLDQTGP